MGERSQGHEDSRQLLRYPGRPVPRKSAGQDQDDAPQEEEGNGFSTLKKSRALNWAWKGASLIGCTGGGRRGGVACMFIIV